MAVFLCACPGNDPEPLPEPLPEPHPDASLTLEELDDMEIYHSGMIVDSRTFKGERVSRILLNGVSSPEVSFLDLRMPGYFRVEIFTESKREPYHIIRLVVLDQERGIAEWGLFPWTPAGLEFQSYASQELTLVYPRYLYGSTAFPIIVIAGDGLGQSLDNFIAESSSGSFSIKRGVGSHWLAMDSLVPPGFSLDHHELNLDDIQIVQEAQILEGSLSSDLNIPGGTVVHIQDDLYIPAGITLSIDKGAVLSIEPAVNIYNEGRVLIRGSEEQPVFISCSDEDSYWGGFIGTTSACSFEVSNAILCRSGYHTGGDYDWGHAHRQALFYCNQGDLLLDHCYMIDHIGQVIYTEYANLDMQYCLLQRAKTGGQQNQTELRIDHCVFTDFPSESMEYQDQDNDGLYLIECRAEINHSQFMYAKDDGLDSGGGSAGGTVVVRNSRFESIFHEGAALSGGSQDQKTQHFVNCFFGDCGQGIEMGFGSKNHYVLADSCTFVGNGIGIRYGDNYDYPHRGRMEVRNSSSTDNISYDVWNMNREYWAADTAQMHFENVIVSMANPMYPELIVRQ